MDGAAGSFPWSSGATSSAVLLLGKAAGCLPWQGSTIGWTPQLGYVMVSVEIQAEVLDWIVFLAALCI